MSASVTTTYDCINPGAGLHIPKAFQNIEETITSSGTFFATKNGQVTGSVTLYLESQGELRCPPPQQSPEPLNGGWTIGGWSSANLLLESIGGVTMSRLTQATSRTAATRRRARHDSGVGNAHPQIDASSPHGQVREDPPPTGAIVYETETRMGEGSPAAGLVFFYWRPGARNTKAASLKDSRPRSQ